MMFSLSQYSQSVLVIFSFWMVFVLAFLLFMCRIKCKQWRTCKPYFGTRQISNQQPHHRNQNRERSIGTRASSISAQDTQRVIQIFYIGNVNSGRRPPPSPRSILNKIIEDMEDLPPNYEDATVNSNSPEHTREQPAGEIQDANELTLSASELTNNTSTSSAVITTEPEPGLSDFRRDVVSSGNDDCVVVIERGRS